MTWEWVINERYSTIFGWTIPCKGCFTEETTLLSAKNHSVPNGPSILLIFRSTHDLVAMDGWLYAVGGNDGSSSLNSIEKYNPRSNKWVAASCMFTRRSSVGVAVLELLNFPPPSSPTLSVSSTSLWQRVKTRLSSSGLPCVAKRRNCSVRALDEECFVGQSALLLPGGTLQHSADHEGKKRMKWKHTHSHTL